MSRRPLLLTFIKALGWSGRLLVRLAVYAGAYVAIGSAVDKFAWPPLLSVHAAASEQLLREMALDALATLGRWIPLYVTGATLGLAMGIILGMSRNVHRHVSVDVNALRTLPATAMLSIVIGLLGVGRAVQFPAFYITVWTIAYLVSQHMAAAGPRRRIEHVRQLGASAGFVVWPVLIREFADPILVAAKQTISLSFLVLVSTEMILGATEGNQGLGTAIFDHNFIPDPPVVWLYLLAIGVLGVALNGLGETLHNRLTPWRRES